MFLNLIRKRRSIRKYKQEHIDREKIELLIEAALRSPSSRSLNPWEFVIVQDRELLGKLSLAKPHGSSFLKGAPLGIVVVADPERCDVWVEDTSIASIFIQLAAESLALRSCWIQIRKRKHDDEKSAEDYVREILNIPHNLTVASIIAIGDPAEQNPPHAQSELDYTKIHNNGYGDNWA